MATSKQICTAFRRLADAPFGATFHKVDFHFHTPASEDARGKNRYGFNPYRDTKYPKGEDHSWARAKAIRDIQAKVLKQARALADEMVARFVAEGLRVVAVTDHNALGTIWPDPEGKSMDLAAPSWYELIDDAAARRAAADPAERVTILPGVEVSTAGVHILGVFPPTRPRRKVHFTICSLLDEIGIGVDEFGSNPKIGHASPQDAIAMIDAKGGVAIIAHIDGNDKALFELHEIGSTPLAEVLCHPQLHAVEMVKAERLLSTPKQLRKRSKPRTLGQWVSEVRDDAELPGLAFFQGSDAHDLRRIGARYAYLMMSDPGFGGLHDAIRSPSSRVRVGALLEDPPAEAVTLYGVELEHPHFGKARARFNRHLNCVVGGPDAGKSLLLALLALAGGGDGDSTLAAKVRLFVEHRVGEDRRRYCFTRGRGGAVELFALSGEGEELEATAVDAEDPELLALRPRSYDAERMEALIRSVDELQAFLEGRVGKPSEARIADFNRRFELPKFLHAGPDPLLVLGRTAKGAYTLKVNLRWRRGRAQLQAFSKCSASLRRLVIIMIVLVSETPGPVIIDEPADHFDNEDISHFLVPLLKTLKGQRQIILATKNANLAVNADPENYLVLEPGRGGRFEIDSGFALDQRALGDRLIHLLEGELADFERRGQLYR